jgi:hypothetical protein
VCLEEVKCQILDRVASFYLRSGDFNGIPFTKLKSHCSSEEEIFKNIVISLVQDGLISLN